MVVILNFSAPEPPGFFYIIVPIITNRSETHIDAYLVRPSWPRTFGARAACSASRGAAERFPHTMATTENSINHSERHIGTNSENEVRSNLPWGSTVEERGGALASPTRTPKSPRGIPRALQLESVGGAGPSTWAHAVTDLKLRRVHGSSGKDLIKQGVPPLPATRTQLIPLHPPRSPPPARNLTISLQPATQRGAG
jgi:hypothetical protein